MRRNDSVVRQIERAKAEVAARPEWMRDIVRYAGGEGPKNSNPTIWRGDGKGGESAVPPKQPKE